MIQLVFIDPHVSIKNVLNPKEGGTVKQNFLRTLHRILFYVLCLCFVISPIYAAGQSDWIGTTSLPEAIDWPDLTLVYGNYIYSSAGAEQTPGKSLYFAPVQVDGSLGDWNPTLNLPAGSYNAWINYAAFAVNNGVIYSISGQPWFRVSSNRVYFSKIQADGAISDWSETVSIPEARMNSSAFFYNQRLYLTGGSQGWYATDPPVSTVYYTSVYSDGTLGDWTTTEPLPRARSFHTSTAYNNFVYTAGGQYKDMDKTAVEVLYAPILASGAIGTSQETTPLPDSEGANLVGCQIFVRGGCMYVLKRQGNHFKTDIKADGSIGAWTSWKATSIGVSGGDTGGFAMSENTEHFYALGGELDGGIITRFNTPLFQHVPMEAEAPALSPRPLMVHQ